MQAGIAAVTAGMQDVRIAQHSTEPRPTSANSSAPGGGGSPNDSSAGTAKHTGFVFTAGCPVGVPTASIAQPFKVETCHVVDLTEDSHGNADSQPLASGTASVCRAEISVATKQDMQKMGSSALAVPAHSKSKRRGKQQKRKKQVPRLVGPGPAPPLAALPPPGSSPICPPAAKMRAGAQRTSPFCAFTTILAASYLAA
jgi:hypothetical protein